MDIKKAQFERKLLVGEDGWIDLSDGIRLKVDYLTQQEDTQHHRLERKQMFGLLEPTDPHPDDFYLSCAVKEIKGLTIEGKAYKLGDKIEELGDRDILGSLLKAAGVYDLALMKTRSKLLSGGMEKKLEITARLIRDGKYRGGRAPLSPASPAS